MTDFTYHLDADGVAIITWDAPDKTMNVLTREAFELVEALIDRALSDDAVRGIVLTSGKKDFAGGMDLNVLANIRAESGDEPAQALFNFTMNGHRILRKLERAGLDAKTNKGGKPIACAINGTCAGIGTEIALACHRRFMTDNPKAKIGLPEILLGIFPGGGGTTRYSRMVGAMAAAPVLLEGKMLAPKAAKMASLVDEIVAPQDLIARAKEWVLSAKDSDIVKPWDTKGYKMPGGTPYHPAGFATFVGASAMVHGKTQGVYPAAKALLSAVYEGALVPFDTALKIEARWFVHILMNPSSSAMIRSLFLNKQALEKGAVRPLDIPDQSVRKLGVLGAGMMGAGIALVAAQAGIEVILIDRDQESAERGKSYSAAYMDKGIARKKATPEKKEAILAKIQPSANLSALADCDLIVEAIFEDPTIKGEMTKKVEAIIGPDCIFASNTSTLPITDLARASARPEQFVGIHFFSPVERMMLVEIIRGKETGPRAVAKALDFARQIKKTPIVVNDARFFYANRCIIPYLNEGMRMLGEAIPPALIENSAKMVGMPLGPLQLVDETSIDLGAKIARATRAALGEAYRDDAVDDVIFWMEERGRLGRKAGAGFYDYDERSKRVGLWPELAARFGSASSPLPDVTTLQHRLLMIQALEAVRALEEGVLSDIREGDVGAILGWGFAPWSGGPFSWLDMLGPQKALEICETLANQYGERFTPPALMRDMAVQDALYYTRFAAAQSTAA